jgi:hypothetical protein
MVPSLQTAANPTKTPAGVAKQQPLTLLVIDCEYKQNDRNEPTEFY